MRGEKFLLSWPSMRRLFPLLWVVFVISLRAEGLPESIVFVNQGKYQDLIQRGIAEKWSALPVGERATRVGLALVGTPYKNYTLELDDRI